ncbi:hypothetical protein HK102_006455 [Quaeritorhiza haematococci]|nr:hypothetical protein HK102_006455 [Quaeritorhiza haematococci]
MASSSTTVHSKASDSPSTPPDQKSLLSAVAQQEDPPRPSMSSFARDTLGYLETSITHLHEDGENAAKPAGTSAENQISTSTSAVKKESASLSPETSSSPKSAEVEVAVQFNDALDGITSEDDMAKMLEEEAIWGLEGSVKGANEIAVKRIGSKIVYLLYDDDERLFDEVVDFKRSNPTAGLQQALQEFCPKPKGDAIARIVYSDHTTYWDAILKYDCSLDGKTDEERLQKRRARLAFELELLERNVFIVREQAPDTFKRSENARYVKVMVPFDTLASEAERLRMRFPCRQRRFVHVKNRVNEVFKQIKSGRRVRRSAIMSPTTRDVVSDMKSDGPASPDASGNQQQQKVVTIGGMQVQVDDDEVLEASSYREGSDGTLWNSFLYMMAIVPKSIKVDTALFQKKYLSDFRGGNGPVTQVQTKFFSTRNRNLIVWHIVNRCKIKGFMNKNGSLGWRDLKSANIYTEFYAVHDGPHKYKTDAEVKAAEEALAAAADNKDGEVVTGTATASRSMGKSPSFLWGGNATTKQRPPNLRAFLYHTWTAPHTFNLGKLLAAQPLREIKEYFGEKIAFYFAWLGKFRASELYDDLHPTVCIFWEFFLTI